MGATLAPSTLPAQEIVSAKNGKPMSLGVVQIAQPLFRLDRTLDQKLKMGRLLSETLESERLKFLVETISHVCPFFVSAEKRSSLSTNHIPPFGLL